MKIFYIIYEYHGGGVTHTPLIPEEKYTLDCIASGKKNSNVAKAIFCTVEYEFEDKGDGGYLIFKLKEGVELRVYAKSIPHDDITWFDTSILDSISEKIEF